MSWFNVLKSPRGFLEGIAEKHGGNVKGRISKAGHANFQLQNEWLKILVKSDRQGKMHVHLQSDYGENESYSDFDLSEIYSKVLNKLDEDTEKAAGAVTTATPGIINVRYSPKKEDEEDGEEED